MPRIALLFSGLPRQWSHCVASQLKLFRDNPCDVYFHFWDTVDAAEKAQIVAAYRPVAHRFEKQIDFSTYEKALTRLDKINSPSRLMSMYYGWKAVANLFADHCRTKGAQYDFAVRIRADLLFTCALDKVLPELGPNDLFVSSKNNFKMINDTFALGRVAPVMYYLSMFDHVPEYNKSIQLNPEMMLIEHLRRRPDIRLLAAPLPILIFRSQMVGKPLEQCMKEDPGLNKWEDPEILHDHVHFHARNKNGAMLNFVHSFIDGQVSGLKAQRKWIADGQPPKP